MLERGSEIHGQAARLPFSVTTPMLVFLGCAFLVLSVWDLRLALRRRSHGLWFRGVGRCLLAIGAFCLAFGLSRWPSFVHVGAIVGVTGFITYLYGYWTRFSESTVLRPRESRENMADSGGAWVSGWNAGKWTITIMLIVGGICFIEAVVAFLERDVMLAVLSGVSGICFAAVGVYGWHCGNRKCTRR